MLAVYDSYAEIGKAYGFSRQNAHQKSGRKGAIKKLTKMVPVTVYVVDTTKMGEPIVTKEQI